MSKTISAAYTNTFNLSDPDTTFTSLATVMPASYAVPAVYGAAGTAWTVTNAGQLKSGGTPTGFGVELVGGGVVNNLSGGVIQADKAVVLGAAGIVNNAGLIRGQGPYSAVALQGGGTVTNSGTIIGGVAGTAVTLAAGFANRVVDVAGGVFTGIVDGGNTIGAATTSTLELASTTSQGTLSGLGTQFVNFARTTVDSGSSWYVSGAIGTGVTIVDSGTLAPVTLTGGGTVTVAVGGTIVAPDNGPYAAVSLVNGGTLVNYGSVYSPSFYSVYSTGGGSVTNALGGTMAKRFAAKGSVCAGVTLFNAGQMQDAWIKQANAAVTFATTGTIAGQSIGLLLGGTTGTATLVNAGLITGSFLGASGYNGFWGTNLSTGTIGGPGALSGLRLSNFGTIIDAGLISGTNTGITLSQDGVVTVQAGGTVSGGTYAILFTTAASAPNQIDRLAIDPNAVISGKVKATRLSTLELMSGTSAGTLTNIASQFISFASVSIDSGAVWTLSGASVIASRSRQLVNSGSLAIAGTLNTYGTITPGGNGIQFISGAAGRMIVHAGFGLSGPGTIDGASGTLELATGYYPAKLYALTSLTNFASVTIDTGANWQIFGAVPNTAPIIDSGTLRLGVNLATGAQLSITATGTVTDSYSSSTAPAAISGAGTVWDAGSIAASTYGVQFSSGFANRLILAPGAFTSGTVSGGNTIGSSIASTLELASGASTGTLSGLGSRFINFGQIALDAGARWVLGGTNTIAAGITLTETNATLTVDGNLVNNGGIVLDPSTMVVANLYGTGSVTIQAGSTLEVQGSIASTETIVFAGANAYLHLDNPANAHGDVVNFDNTDQIDLKGVDPGSVSYAAGQLNFSGGNSFPLTTPSNNPVQTTASADGAEVTALCFLPDTLIQTPTGQVKVQDLKAGNLVTTLAGAQRPVSWIGTGSVLATRGKRGPATPVIIRKGAFAPNVPTLDLRVTKGHSFLFDGVLIPIEYLVNHHSIVWDDRAREVTVHHIELDIHDILIANGAPAESYRDDGNRWLFHNANSGWDQSAKAPCVPVVTGGPIVDAVWRRLLDRAGPRPRQTLTDAPDLHLLIDGQRFEAAFRDSDRYVFRLSGQPTHAAIASRRGAPQELGLSRDPRVLGVAIERLLLWKGARVRTVEASDDRLCHGFHGFEPDLLLRWTDGQGAIPRLLFEGFEGRTELEIHVAATALYQDDIQATA